MTILMAKSMESTCLRVTANYIIAFILMFILIALLSTGMTWLGQNYRTMGDIAGVIFIILLIWLPINDIRKAILYFKNTI